MTSSLFFKWVSALGFISILFVGGCSGDSNDRPAPIVKFKAPEKSDLQRVWENASVAVPVRGTTGSMITTNSGRAGPPQGLAGVSSNIRWPVVVVMPGCLQSMPVSLMRAVAEQGYVVLSPSSNSRFFQPLNCKATDNTQARAAATLNERRLEIRYVLEKLGHERWIDPTNVFLMGLQDGAAAVARYTGDGVKARILAEWNCKGIDKIKGIARGAQSPVFAATSAVMPIFGGGCGAFLEAGKGSMVLSLPEKYSDNILLEPIVYTQFLRFLDRQIFK